MDNENTKIKDTGSWSPFYYWIVGVVTMCALMWMLPNNYPREPWENIIRVLLGALFIFLFFVCPVWMIISAIRYWKTKDYIRATVAVLIALAILESVLFGPLLSIDFWFHYLFSKNSDEWLERKKELLNNKIDHSRQAKKL